VENRGPGAASAVERLDEITRRLRRECPWDREQDERSIVPHTVEEAYELADAAARGDDTRLLDELGDVLFQVHFLALLLEERGAGSLEQVAEGMIEKLIRRHPHVFGSESNLTSQSPHSRPSADVRRQYEQADTAGEVLHNWDRIKREQEGRGAEDPFADVPENLPALLYARKIQRRAATAGLHDAPVADLDPAARDGIERFIGELLFGIVDVARRLRCDPELALRAAAVRFRDGAARGEDRDPDE
jgi:ATP diphosphatase